MTRSAAPVDVPTLTEVVELPAPRAAGGDADPDAVDGPAEDAVASRLMHELQAHIDRVLEAKVRTALEPVLQQLVTTLVEETRRELASTLRNGMARALAREMSRHRDGP